MTSPPSLSPATTGPRRGGAGRSRPGRLPRLLRGPAADPRWARPSLLALLALTALLYAAGLSRNGWANDFYSAAVQAGTKSWPHLRRWLRGRGADHLLGASALHQADRGWRDRVQPGPPGQFLATPPAARG